MMQQRSKEELKEILKIKKIRAAKGYRTPHALNYWIIANFHKIKAELMERRIKPRRWILKENAVQMLTPVQEIYSKCCGLSPSCLIVQHFDYIFILNPASNSFYHTVFVLEMEEF